MAIEARAARPNREDGPVRIPSTALWCRGDVAAMLDFTFCTSVRSSPFRARPLGDSNTSNSLSANCFHRAAAAKAFSEKKSSGFVGMFPVFAAFGPLARRRADRSARFPSSSNNPSVGVFASRSCADRARLASCDGETLARPLPTRRLGLSSKSSRRPGFTRCDAASPNTARWRLARDLRSRPRPSSNRNPHVTRSGEMKVDMAYWHETYAMCVATEAAKQHTKHHYSHEPNTPCARGEVPRGGVWTFTFKWC